MEEVEGLKSVTDGCGAHWMVVRVNGCKDKDC